MSRYKLGAPELYLNRELCLLEFNRRVFAQATRDELPLLERLRFLCIASSNIDEFFEVRVAGLKQQAAFGSKKSGPDGLTVPEQLERISRVAHELVDQQYDILNDVLFPSLRDQGICFLRRQDRTQAQRDWVREYFFEELLPVLNPIGLDPAHPFPRLVNKSLGFVVTLDGLDAFGRDLDLAVVQAPRSLPRVVRLPEECSEHPYDFVFLTSIIHAHVSDLFPGLEVTGCYQFRVTRNSDLFVDAEEVKDLRHALAGELSSRRFGEAVRLELASQCPQSLEQSMSAQFGLSARDVYLCNGPVNLMRLNQIPDMVDMPDLKFPDFTPGVQKRVRRSNDLFATIRERDVLLHHPFESFNPVVDLLLQAGDDPDVVAIRQTLYRTGDDSPVVDALIDAAQKGTDVLVVIELRARFDEADNIELSTELQEAGAQVVYGVVGIKTHAKMIQILRREGSELRSYVHLGTGNYHTTTARFYTDFGLMSCDADLGDDVQNVFRQLSSMGQAGELSKILQAPFTLKRSLKSLLQQEVEHARAGRPARVIAKMNSLVDPSMIRSLYKASQAGVEIDLIVRGMCTLRPGLKDISENIRVRSIIGRFLEHTRIFCFENAGAPNIYLSSADWMPRNFDQRVETCFPVLDPKIAARVRSEGLDPYLKDNCQAWELQPDGTYSPRRADDGRVSAQDCLLEKLAVSS